ncbi:hypothetical protein D3C81_1948530 [compost metagenome]
MTDVAGKQPLAVQSLAQAAQGGVEGNRQFTHFIGGIVWSQRGGQTEQLVTVAHLPCQPDHRRHHFTSQDPAQEYR